MQNLELALEAAHKLLTLVIRTRTANEGHTATAATTAGSVAHSIGAGAIPWVAPTDTTA